MHKKNLKRNSYGDFKNFIRVAFLSAPLLLAACHSDLGPYPMPSGYKYHGKASQSPAGPEPVFDKIEHMEVPDKNAPSKQICQDAHKANYICMAHKSHHLVTGDVADGVYDYDMAAQDLVRRLVAGFGKPAEPVFVEAKGANDAMAQAIENALRAQSVTVAQQAGQTAYKMTYDVSAIGAAGTQSKMVTIILKAHDAFVAQESGLYDLAGNEAPVMSVPIDDAPAPVNLLQQSSGTAQTSSDTEIPDFITPMP